MATTKQKENPLDRVLAELREAGERARQEQVLPIQDARQWGAELRQLEGRCTRLGEAVRVGALACCEAAVSGKPYGTAVEELRRPLAALLESRHALWAWYWQDPCREFGLQLLGEAEEKGVPAGSPEEKRVLSIHGGPYGRWSEHAKLPLAESVASYLGLLKPRETVLLTCLCALGTVRDILRHRNWLFGEPIPGEQQPGRIVTREDMRQYHAREACLPRARRSCTGDQAAGFAGLCAFHELPPEDTPAGLEIPAELRDIEMPPEDWQDRLLVVAGGDGPAAGDGSASFAIKGIAAPGGEVPAGTGADSGE